MKNTDAQNNQFLNMPQSKSGVVSLYILLLCLTLSCIVFSVLAFRTLTTLKDATEQMHHSYLLSEELRLSSDRLTLMARAYVATGNEKYLQFFNDILDIRNGIKPRPEHYEQIYWDFRMPEKEQAVTGPGKIQSFRSMVTGSGFSHEEIDELAQAQQESDTLTLLERRAFRLTEMALLGQGNRQKLRDQAIDLMYSQDYLESKVRIMTHINSFIQMQADRTSLKVENAEARLRVMVLLTIASYIALSGCLFFNFRMRNRIDKLHIIKLQKEVKKRIRAEEGLLHSLEDKNILLRELNHRTKNTLQQMRSLLFLEGQKFPGNGELQQLILDSSNRIQAIAMVHQHLYKYESLSQLSIQKYIDELCHMILAGFAHINHNIQCHLDIPDRFFLFDEVIPIALILNELLTNSLKHAFPDGREGLIKISMIETDSNHYILNYSDNGVGLPETLDTRTAESLGLQLIYSLGEGQLLGRVEMSGKQGVHCRLEFNDEGYSARV